MKIGLVLANTPAYSETFFRNKIRFLQEEGFEVVIYADRQQSLFEDCKVRKAFVRKGFRVKDLWHNLSLLLKLLIYFPQVLKLYQFNKTDGFTVREYLLSLFSSLHILGEKLDCLHFGFGTMALGRENLANAIGAKMAVSFRGFDYYIYPVKNPDAYQCLFSKNVSYHVLSKGMKNGLILQGIPSSSIQIITPAIDLSLFSSFEENNSQNRKVISFISVARLHWIKGLDYTLEALAILKNKGFDFTFSIIGEGVEEERLKFSAYQLGIMDKVHFLGKLSPQQVKEQLSQSDFYLQYSIQEGFCNAVLEAQAIGKICFVSDAEGLSENVLDEVTGFVIPKRRPELLAMKIEEVLGFPEEKLERIRQQAIQRVKQEFNLEKQKNEFLEFYCG